MRYEFFKEEDGRYTVIDTKWVIRCTFEEHRFNETQQFDTGMIKTKDASTVARAMRELGDWLVLHHPRESMPLQDVSVFLSEDDTCVMLDRNVEPIFTLAAPVGEGTDLDALVEAVRDAAKKIKALGGRF